MNCPPYVHADIDAFYASVEQWDHPESQGKPVIVGGSPQQRSVVASCSYEARAFGVHSAMPMSQALKLCPQALCFPVRMYRYLSVSEQIFSFLSEYAPLMIPFSIDEVFMDFTHTALVYPNLYKTIENIRKNFHKEFHMTLSIGVGSNPYVAKLASKKGKPNGLFILEESREKEYLLGLSLNELWGIGTKTHKKLREKKIQTVKDLQEASLAFLSFCFGPKQAHFLSTIAQGKDPGILQMHSKERSVSVERTFSKDLNTKEEVLSHISELSHLLMQRMIVKKLWGRFLHVKIRDSTFRTRTVQGNTEAEISSTSLAQKAQSLFFRNTNPNHTPIRLLGLGFSGLISESEHTPSLFSETNRHSHIDHVASQIKKKYGQNLIQRARSMTTQPFNKELYGNRKATQNN